MEPPLIMQAAFINNLVVFQKTVSLCCLKYFCELFRVQNTQHYFMYIAFFQVKRTYSHGTYRAGPMRQISLVGAVDEEVGDYFPEFLDMLEDSPFLKVRIKRGGKAAALKLIDWAICF